ncbi:S8 family serine peptidase [Dactylococcopsis salina]|uniref:Subtilisin-like serine protease n=1 Tax=Dactylococcopsis salina (strain PCC 8305) TaxID=13035 RepID=K9YX45_DACS8|nr:S8 family serine peptidase [Dactylococcopsis salina]AFZ50895.1 subtilisin-like serine protease [Dactylococcopsis salina PCC 8305]
MTSSSFETAERIDSTDIIDDSVEAGFDDSDYYVFNLAQESTAEVTLDVSEDDADLYLYDSAQNFIALSMNGGLDSEFIVEELAAGDYYLEVEAWSGFTDYTLDLLSFSEPIIDDNDSFDTANRLDATDIISSDVEVDVDDSDYYVFNLAQESTVNVILNVDLDDADLFLYDSSQNVIASSANAGLSSESIVEELAAGDYYLEVEAWSGFTDYTLDLLSVSEEPTYDDGNNTFESAMAIEIGETKTERVSSSDPEDYYSFNLVNDTMIELNLTGIGGDADLELYDANEEYVDGSSSFDSSETIETFLASGEYFIKIDAYSGEIDYELSLASSDSPSIPDDSAGNSLDEALSIGINDTHSEGVGQDGDELDYFRFELDSLSEVTIGLSGLSADLDLELLNVEGGIISSSEKGGFQDESISALLEAGTYFIKVDPFGPAISSYELEIASETASISPEPNPFDARTGYGFLDASVAVASVLNQDPFPIVDLFGDGDEWAVNMVNAPEVWEQGYTGEGMVVAVLDTGIDRNHPDLFDNIWENSGEIPNNGEDDDGNGFVDDVYGWNFAGNKNDTSDLQGHGTHVAGTIAGRDDGVGVTGVAHNAQIMPVKVLGDDGFGTYQGIANGIVYATQNGADVINMSLGGPNPSPIIEDAIEYAVDQGVIVISAAGNEAQEEPAAPGVFADEFGVVVGSVNRSNQQSSFSNEAGEDPSMIYVTAPGEDIYSSIPGGDYDSWNGTSMATPHVAGIVTLMLEANPDLSDQEVREIISSSTTNSPTITTNSDLSGFGIQSAKSSEIAPSFEFQNDDSIPVEIPESADITDLSAVDDLVFGTSNNDTLNAADQNDPYTGNNQITFTGAGEDLVDGSIAGDGSNRNYGGSNADELFAGNNDRLFGEGGNDTLDASQGTGNNRLYGGDDNDDLIAGNDDLLTGGNGDDRLFVRQGGNNLLIGNSGADQFWIATDEIPNSPNIITDFTSGEDAIGFGSFPDLSFNDLIVNQNGENTLIGLEANNPIAELQGVQANTLTENDFVFAAQSPV